jgi:hypothetical protein
VFDLPSKLEVIESSCFADAHIQSLRLPEHLTALGSDCFRRSSIDNVELAEQLKAIGSLCFAAKSASSVTVSQSVDIKILNFRIIFCFTQGRKDNSRPPPILRFTTCEETISYLFNNIFSPILNKPCKTVHPVVEDALHFIESELIPDLRNHFFNFIARVKLAIFQDSFQRFKEPKVAGA